MAPGLPTVAASPAPAVKTPPQLHRNWALNVRPQRLRSRPTRAILTVSHRVLVVHRERESRPIERYRSAAVVAAKNTAVVGRVTVAIAVGIIEGVGVPQPIGTVHEIGIIEGDVGGIDARFQVRL